MPLELFQAALVVLAEVGSEANVRTFSAPVILTSILAIHGVYFIRNRKLSGQQEITLEDLTNLAGSTSYGAGDLTVVHAARQEFDVATRTAAATNLPLPSGGARPAAQPMQRLRDPQMLEDIDIHHTLICGDDLIVRGRTVFFHPLKVAGDLIVEGEALFRAPVIVSGVLKVGGSAHFAEGMIAKGDAMVRGSMTIGSDSCQGWAVVGELALERQLKLNGTLVASRAVQLKRAA